MAARKKVTAQKPEREKAFPQQTQVFSALFDRIADKGLGRVRLSDLSKDLNVSFETFYQYYPSVNHIFDAFFDYLDQQMVKDVSLDSLSDKRDVYFDLFMSRFDTLQKYRSGVVEWLDDLSKHPDLWARTFLRWEKSLSLMLDIAKDSPLFPIKKIGLMAIYVTVLRSWAKDETDDMAKTMAALDKSLGQAQRFTHTFLTKKR